MNTGCRYFLKLVFSFALDKYPEVELLDHMAIFWRTFIHTVFHGNYSNLHYTTNALVFPSFYILANTIFLIFLIISILTGVRWYLMGLNYISMMILSTFSCACWQTGCFSQKNVYLYPLLIFDWIFWVLHISWILIPDQIHDLQIFSPFSRLPFHFVDGFLCHAEAFSLM